MLVAQGSETDVLVKVEEDEVENVAAVRNPYSTQYRFNTHNAEEKKIVEVIYIYIYISRERLPSTAGSNALVPEHSRGSPH